MATATSKPTALRNKRIVLCCDGTWDNSEGTTQPPTNVTKLARSIAREGKRDDGSVIEQIVYYQSGIGSTADTSIDHGFDGATGKGISDHVRQAYGFLCNNYTDGDELFITGFSRGAFTARTITALVSSIGLLTPHGLGYFFSIFRAWERQNQVDKGVSPSESKLGELPMTWQELQAKLDKTDLTRPNIEIKVCAVWDTVGSLGMPIAPGFVSRVFGITAFDDLPSPFSFVDTAVAPNIRHAFHAIALDEHRVHFTPTIWEKPEGQKLPVTLKQCWFTGYHSHIGGGDDVNNTLPNVALAWVMAQLRPFLTIDYTIVKTDPEAVQLAKSLHLEGEANPTSGKILDSKTGWFVFDGLGRAGVRTPGAYTRTDPKTLEPAKPLTALTNTNETIHPTVRLRFWDREFEPFDKHPYRSEALDGWEPEPPAPGTQDPQGTASGGGDVKAKWVNKNWKEGDLGAKELMEEEITDYELEIYKYWFDDFTDIESLDLVSATH